MNFEFYQVSSCELIRNIKIKRKRFLQYDNERARYIITIHFVTKAHSFYAYCIRNTWGEEGKFTIFSVPLHEYKVIKKGMVINLEQLF